MSESIEMKGLIEEVVWEFMQSADVHKIIKESFDEALEETIAELTTETGSEIVKDWQARVIDENVDLNAKIRKLIRLLLGDDFEDRVSSEIDRNLLATQLRHMIKYSESLTNRIERF